MIAFLIIGFIAGAASSLTISAALNAGKQADSENIKEDKEE